MLPALRCKRRRLRAEFRDLQFPGRSGKGLTDNGKATYLSVLRHLAQWMADNGYTWGEPLTNEVVMRYLTEIILGGHMASSYADRVMAVVSRLRRLAPGFKPAPRTDGVDADYELEVFLTDLQKQKPAEVKGMDPFPEPLLTVPRVLRALADTPRQRALGVRMLVLLNTGMRCAESSPPMLKLSDIRVFKKSSGEVDCICLRVRLHKVNKTTTKPLWKFLFRRGDQLDAFCAFADYLSWAHSVSLDDLAGGWGFRPAWHERAAVFPPAAESLSAAVGYDTSDVTTQLQDCLAAAGVTRRDMERQGAHSFRVTFTTLLACARVDPSTVNLIVGWADPSVAMQRGYTAVEGAREIWRDVNERLTAFFRKIE